LADDVKVATLVYKTVKAAYKADLPRFTSGSAGE